MVPKIVRAQWLQTFKQERDKRPSLLKAIARPFVIRFWISFFLLKAKGLSFNLMGLKPSMGQILEQPQPPEKHHFSDFYNSGCMKKVFLCSQLLMLCNLPFKTCAKVDLYEALQHSKKNFSETWAYCL